MRGSAVMFAFLLHMLAFNSFAEEINFPADVMERIKNQLGSAVKNTAEILKDPENYEVASAYDSGQLAFVIQTKAFAYSMSDFDKSRGGISSSLTVTLSGVDAAVMQETTDRAYQDYLARLANAGFSTGQPVNRISSETTSTVILPTLVVNFAEVSSSERWFAATSASVGAEMGITLNGQSTYHLRVAILK